MVSKFTALLVGGSASSGTLIRECLETSTDGLYCLENVADLEGCAAMLKAATIDVLMTELLTNDVHGMDALGDLLTLAPYLPLVVIGDVRDEGLTEGVLLLGAQDFLLSNHLDSYNLTRALSGAIVRKRADDVSFAERDRAQVTLNSIGDAVLSTDISGQIIYLNKVAERMTGWARDAAVGRPLSDVFRVIDGESRGPLPNPMEMAVRENKTVGLSENSVLIRRDGTESAIADSAAPIHDRTGRVTGAVIVFHDVTETRALTIKMYHQARHDYLTDLPNQLLFIERLTSAMTLAKRHRHHLAILFLDLDHLKHINDSLGHSIGDQLLKAVSHRLMAALRESDTLSRQGGDEFLVLLPEVERPEQAAVTAEKLRTTLLGPYLIEDHDLHITASIGVSIYPEDGTDAQSLIQSADTAMYHAKDSGRNNYQFFELAMNVRAVARQSTEASLRRALERHELVLNYQPEVDLQTGLITGGEALIRWNHPERGMLLPNQFIPIAEDSDLILGIGEWVLRSACSQAKEWVRAGYAFKQIAVNISARELGSKGFLDLVASILRQTGLPPSFLELELTETALMLDVDAAAAVLRALSALGVRLAIDDFGTGYSSLGYLKLFPITTLKIDQMFVRDVAKDPDDAAMVSAIIAMAKNLRHRIVAEGVESGEQIAFLRSRACGEAQGYYYSKPVTAEIFMELLENGLPRLRDADVPLGTKGPIFVRL